MNLRFSGFCLLCGSIAGIVLAAVGAGLVLYSKAELDAKKPKTDAAKVQPATPAPLG